MKKYIEKSMTYESYLELIDTLLAEGKTTGPSQSEAMFNYGKLNRQRMKRLDQTVDINESLKLRAKKVERKMIWLTITEGWCGDAAQNIPLIEKIAAENLKIETRYVLRDELRDENLDLIDRFLTNNARSIPKLICLDAETLEELGTWGPRPQVAIKYLYEMKSHNLEKAQMMENMQRWYIQDKNQSLQTEFENLLTGWAETSKTTTAVNR